MKDNCLPIGARMNEIVDNSCVWVYLNDIPVLSLVRGQTRLFVPLSNPNARRIGVCRLQTADCVEGCFGSLVAAYASKHTNAGISDWINSGYMEDVFYRLAVPRIDARAPLFSFG
jgi:hypothetical protein